MSSRLVIPVEKVSPTLESGRLRLRAYRNNDVERCSGCIRTRA
jgi:hypothetical protein